MDQYDEAQKVYPKAFLRIMESLYSNFVPGKSRIVACSSAGTHNPGTFYAAIAPAKAALEVLVKHYAANLSKKGILVNYVIPGFIKTAEWDKLFQYKPNLENLPKNSLPENR
eukprot:UN10885